MPYAKVEPMKFPRDCQCTCSHFHCLRDNPFGDITGVACDLLCYACKIYECDTVFITCPKSYKGELSNGTK
jgi:hypothetical protein